jgi:putative transposase
MALGHTNNQKISSWPHGRLRQYITYKAQAAGMVVELVDEAYTTQECPNCHKRHKPRGRNYHCPVCGFVSHRDAVGSANILSRYLYSELGFISPPGMIKYGHHKPSRATTILARNTAELYKDKHNHTVLPFSKTFS